jgi:hypothetical protein
LSLPGLKALPAIIATMALLAAGTARADEGVTLQGGVEPLRDGALTVGCQASFGVARHDKENFANGSVLALGSLSLITVNGKPRAVLKLGLVHEDDSDPSPISGGLPSARPPLAAVLQEDGGDPTVNNQADSLGTAPPEQGYGLFLFNMGPATREVLAQAARNGRFKVAYLLKEGARPSRFVADVTVTRRDMLHSDNTVISAKARDDLAACVGSLLK